MIGSLSNATGLPPRPQKKITAGKEYTYIQTIKISICVLMVGLEAVTVI